MPPAKLVATTTTPTGSEMNTKKKFIALLSVAALTSAVVGVATTSGKSTESELRQLWNTTNEYPEVVVTINGTPISGKWLTYAVATARRNDQLHDKPIRSKTKAAKEALDAVIDSELINQEVARRGYTATDQEIDNFLDEQIALILAHPSPENDATLEGMGVTTWAEYKANTAVRDDVAKQVASIKMFTVLEADPKFDLDKFKKDLRKGADIQIKIQL